MSLLTNLFRLIPPSFRAGYCPPNVQQLVNDAIAGTQVTFLIQQGNFIYNMGSVTPTPENRIYPWLYTPNGRWYTFQFGLWTSPHPIPQNSFMRQLWVGRADGSPTGIWTYDEGDGIDPSVTSPTLYTGSFWDIDSDFAAKFPVGPGTTAGGTVITTKEVDPTKNTGGADTHTLTEAEGGSGTHIHGIGKYLNGAGDFPSQINYTVPGYTGAVIQGISGGPVTATDTQINMFTLPSGTDAVGVPSPTAFPTLPPYQGAYVIKRTIRAYYTLPA